jgi:hypothetical protein
MRKTRNRKVRTLRFYETVLKPFRSVLVLVLGVAVNCAGTRAERATDCSTFKRIARLVTDDAASNRSKESAAKGAALCVRASWSGAVT